MDKYIGISASVLYEYIAHKKREELQSAIPNHYKTKKGLGNKNIQPQTEQ